MKRIKGNIWDLFETYDILCIPFITITDNLDRPVVKEGTFFQESITIFQNLYANFIKVMRNKDGLLKQVLISSDKQKVILSFPSSNNIKFLREKDVILRSSELLRDYIDENFNDYFRVLIPPFDYSKSNGYLEEIIGEMSTILDYRFNIVMPEDYNG